MATGTDAHIQWRVAAPPTDPTGRAAARPGVSPDGCSVQGGAVLMPRVRKRHWAVFLALGISVCALAACAVKLNGTAPTKSSTAAAAAVPHGLPVPGIPQSPGLNFASGGSQFDPPTAPYWTLLATSGFGLARTHLTWAVVQPPTAPPNFHNDGYNAFVQHLKSLHIRPVFELSYCNPAFPSPATASGRKAFAAFAADAAQHFRNDGVIWEIWNEPNGGYWNCTGQTGGAVANPDAYAKLAIATSTAIWKVDPSATIIGPASSNFDWTWFHQLATDGMLGALSAFSVHGYGANTPEEQAPNYALLQAFLARHPVNGHPLPIVMSEWGWETFNPLPTGWCCNLAVQAEYVVRMMLDDLQAGVDFSVWYQFQGGTPTNDSGGQGSYGLVFGGTLAPKPSYQAMQVLSSTLSGQNYVAADDVAACTATEHAIRLSKGGEAFWAVSTVPIPTAVVPGHFYVGSDSVTLVSQDGTRSQVTATNGVLAASFRPSVTYVVGATGQVPPPAHVRLPNSVGLLMEDFYAREPVGTPASLMGSPPGNGKVVLLWHPLCGISAYRILSGGSASGPWQVQTTTRKSIWIGTAPTSPTWYTVASVSPAGVVGPVAPPVENKGGGRRPVRIPQRRSPRADAASEIRIRTRVGDG